MICPICNGLRQIEKNCPNCHAQLEDQGKVSDFLDPYGHYNDIETVKSADGYPETVEDKICPHLMVCTNCGHENVKFVQEQLF